MTHIILHELRLGLRQLHQWIFHCSFFILIILLFVFGIAPEQSILAAIGPGLIWLSILLFSMMAGQTLFHDTLEDGSLRALYLHQPNLLAIIAAKLIARLVLIAIPLWTLIPLLGYSLLNIPLHQLPMLMIGVVITTPLLLTITASAAAMTCGGGSQHNIMPLLTLPLYIPFLIIATSGLTQDQLSLSTYSLQLLSLALFTLPITLFTMWLALRYTLQHYND